MSSNFGLSYVGPGAGLNMLGTLFGFIGAVFLSLFFVLFIPIKKMMNSRAEKNKKKENLENL